MQLLILSMYLVSILAFTQEQANYFGLLESRLPQPSMRKGITFEELEQFFALLNNISDFALAFRQATNIVIRCESETQDLSVFN